MVVCDEGERGAGQAGEVRKAIERQVDLHRDAFDFERANCGVEIRGSSRSSNNFKNVTLGSALEATTRARISSRW